MFKQTHLTDQKDIDIFQKKYLWVSNVVILKLHYSVQCYGSIQLTSDQPVTCGNIDHQQSTGMYGDTSNQYRVCPEIGYPKIQWFIIIFSMKLAILGYFTMFKRAFTSWTCNNGNSLKQHSKSFVTRVTNDFVWFGGENTPSPVVESIISPFFFTAISPVRLPPVPWCWWSGSEICWMLSSACAWLPEKDGQVKHSETAMICHVYPKEKTLHLQLARVQSAYGIHCFADAHLLQFHSWNPVVSLILHFMGPPKRVPG